MELARREDVWLRPMSADDLALLVRWRNEPHVRRWWEMDGDPVPFTLADAEAELGPVLRGQEPASAAIVVLGQRPVGYVQWYRWAGYTEEVAATGIADDGGAFGLDILIGDPDAVGKGVGSTAVDLVCHLTFAERGASSVALLTAVGNLGAQRAYEKAGFHKVRRALDTDVKDGRRVESWLMVRDGDAARRMGRVGTVTTPDMGDAFGHHVWATVRLIDTCTELSQEQLATAVPGTYGSILDTLRHLVGSDAWYLFVLSEGATPQIDEDHMDLSALTDAMERHRDRWSSLLDDGVDPTAETVAHHDDGSQTRSPRGIRFAQALHHGTDHRSQICTALTQLGIEPPNIDVWAFGELDGRVVEVPAGP